MGGSIAGSGGNVLRFIAAKAGNLVMKPNSRMVLWAEDNDEDIELTLHMLAKQAPGIDVTVVRDGVEALDYLFHSGKYNGRATPDPSVVLLDIKMPKVDGIEVLRRMKGDERLNKIPVVMLSSSNQRDDVEESYRLGASAYIVKPVDFSEFAESVKTACVFWALVNTLPSKA